MKTLPKHRVLFFLCKLIGYNFVIYHDAGITKYSKRIEVHK